MRFSDNDAGSGSGSGDLVPYSASGSANEPDEVPYEDLLLPANCNAVLPLPVGDIADAVRRADAVAVELGGISESTVSPRMQFGVEV